MEGRVVPRHGLRASSLAAVTDLERVLEVGMRGATCMSMHRIVLESCQHAGVDQTSNVFLAGHRLRLEISSSNFPHYNRNANTGKEATCEEDLLVAHQTIYHDAEHPSHIVLPVIPANP